MEENLEQFITEEDVNEIVDEFDSKITILSDATEYAGCDSAAAMYLYDIARTVPLSQDKKLKVIEAMNRLDKDDPEYIRLRNALVNSDMKLVASLAIKNMGHGVELADLISEGSFGLIKAIEKYSPDKECSLTTYAYKWIKLYIDLAIQKYGSSITVPMYIKVRLIQLYREETLIAQATGRAPEEIPEEELAGPLKMDPSEIKSLRDIRARNFILSIDKLTEQSEEEKKRFEVPDPAPLITQTIEDDETRAKFINMIDTLLPKEKQRDVIKMHYGFTTGEFMTFESIARYYESLGYTRGITREAIRQTHDKALSILQSVESKQKFMEAFYE